MMRTALILALAIQALAAPVAQTDSFGFGLGDQYAGTSTSFGYPGQQSSGTFGNGGSFDTNLGGGGFSIGDESTPTQTYPQPVSQASDPDDEIPTSFYTGATLAPYSSATAVSSATSTTTSVSSAAASATASATSSAMMSTSSESASVNSTKSGLDAAVGQGYLPPSANSTTSGSSNSTMSSAMNSTQSGLNAAVAQGYLPPGANSTTSGAGNATMSQNSTQSGLNAAVAQGYLPPGANSTGMAMHSATNGTSNSTQSSLNAAVEQGYLPPSANSTESSNSTATADSMPAEVTEASDSAQPMSNDMDMGTAQAPAESSGDVLNLSGPMTTS